MRRGDLRLDPWLDAGGVAKHAVHSGAAAGRVS